MLSIFNIQLVLGYIPWLLGSGTYIWPRLEAMDQFEVQRAIATLHSFRFFGLIFILPGVVGPNLPPDFATRAAYGDFTTGVLAMLALVTARMRPLFWVFVVAFNVVGTIDIVGDYYHGYQLHLADLAGELGGTGYEIVMIYVPLLMITHVVAFYLLMRAQSRVTRAPNRDVVAAYAQSALKQGDRLDRRIRWDRRFGKVRVHTGLNRHLVGRYTPKFGCREDLRDRQIRWSALAYAATIGTQAEGQAEQHSARIATVLTCDDDKRTPHIAEFSSISRCRAATWLLLSGTLQR